MVDWVSFVVNPVIRLDFAEHNTQISCVLRALCSSRLVLDLISTNTMRKYLTFCDYNNASVFCSVTSVLEES